MDMTILQVIQGWHTPVLDKIMVTLFNSIIDEKGVFAVLLGLLLLAIPKTRKCGLLMLLSILVSYLLGGVLLKNLFCRPRPFYADTSVALITEAPSGYSCPSLHTALAFACATVVTQIKPKAGPACYILAAAIGFSRLYFFVHYPSDVLLGALLGTLSAVAVTKAVKAYRVKKESVKDQQEV